MICTYCVWFRNISITPQGGLDQWKFQGCPGDFNCQHFCKVKYVPNWNFHRDGEGVLTKKIPLLEGYGYIFFNATLCMKTLVFYMCLCVEYNYITWSILILKYAQKEKFSALFLQKSKYFLIYNLSWVKLESPSIFPSACRVPIGNTSPQFNKNIKR